MLCLCECAFVRLNVIVQVCGWMCDGVCFVIAYVCSCVVWCVCVMCLRLVMWCCMVCFVCAVV